MVIVQQLGKILPTQYVAGPRVHLGAQAEIDVATFDQQRDSTGYYEVRVYDARRGRRLVAAIEIVSPGNKDRPESRAQFVAKCAALLRQRVSVVPVDVVTPRDFDWYAELLQWIDARDESLGDEPPAAYAVACCWRPRGMSHWLESWNHPLVPGETLPVLPLWLTDELAIPLDLEASYEQTCRDLRIA